MNAIHNREEFFIRLYKEAFPVVAKYISRRGGSFDEAKDVFHDSLVIYYEKTVQQALNTMSKSSLSPTKSAFQLSRVKIQLN